MIRLKGIKNIIFDFGGVLVDLNPQACLDKFAQLGLPQVADYLTPYGHKGPFGQIENGDIDLPAFRQEIKTIFKVNLDDEQIDEAWSAFLMHIPYKKMKLVHELAKKYRVFLLSNTNPIHIKKLQEFDDSGFPVSECFEKLYLSYEIGHSKPGREIYEFLLSDAGILPEETLLVDDGPANCKTAEALGLHTYQPLPFEDFTDEFTRPEKCVATMGFFDGLHKGHKFLIDETRKIASDKGLPSMVISFWPHPRTVLNTNFYPQLLTTKDEKEEFLKATNVDYVKTLTFDKDLAQMGAKDFMQKVLKDEFNVSCLVIGYDHKFGNKRSEDFDQYVQYGRELGIEVFKASPYLLEENQKKEISAILKTELSENATVSSSLIRRTILAGSMHEANDMLGYTYSLKGKVVGGQQIGRTLGFPTANIEPDDENKIIPAMGIYAVWVDYEGKKYKGMLDIGRRPTLHKDSDLTIEVHLIGFSGNLYGKVLKLEFVERFRKEFLFTDIESLVNQLRLDQEYVENYLKD